MLLKVPIYLCFLALQSESAACVRDGDCCAVPGKAHLKEALLQHEEALRVNRMCRELRKKDALHCALRHAHDRCLDKYADVDDEDDFTEQLEPPPVLAATTFQLTLAYPDFSRHKVTAGMEKDI